MHREMPKLAHAYGDIDSRKAPTLKDSPLPVKSMSVMVPWCQPWQSNRKRLHIRISARTKSHHDQKRPDAAYSIRITHDFRDAAAAAAIVE